MAKAWLILADILLHLCLFISLILFYLFPVQRVPLPLEEIAPMGEIHKDENSSFTLPKSMLGIFTTRLPTLEDLRSMSRMYCGDEAYITENEFAVRTLKDALKITKTKVGDPVFIRIFKEESILEVWIKNAQGYVHLKDYAICAASGNLGPKLKEGDKQSPEGFYKVHMDQLNPNSKFHLSFNLGYPNAYDRAHGRTGSFLMVHGNCVSVGCYAMTDENIEEIYALVKGALEQGESYVNVHAYPFKMTEANMDLYEGNEWYAFWSNLKEGYDYFEAEKMPPEIRVEEKRYVVYEANE